jgi:DNA invertase Pin-like site-specific DNA recombinase
VKAAIYLRQSLDRFGNELAVDRQRDDCLKLCADKGWEPVEYPDNDTSATSGKREHYQRMLADIEVGKVGAVVVWDLDRLHRQPIELEAFMKLADRHGIKLATVTGDCDLSTDNGRLFARIKGAVAMSEVERKSARQKRASTQRAKAGHPWWRSRPFGFDADRDRETGKWWTAKRDPERHNPIREHPIEADLLRAAYDDVKHGTSLSALAASWNNAGITTSTGHKWHASSVRVLLLNARNAGLREHHGKVIGPGTWPAIVTEQTWREVRARLLDPKRKGRPVGGRKRLLTGIALCGVCGQPLGSSITHRSGTLTYVCKTPGCMKVSRAAAPVDAMVVEAVIRRLSQKDAIGLTRRDHIDTADLSARRDHLVVQQRLAAEQFAKGDVSMEFAVTADQQLAEQIAAIDEELTDHSKAPVFDGLVGIEDVDAAFDAESLDRRRAVIAALVKITVQPSGRGARKVRPQDVQIQFV